MSFRDSEHARTYMREYREKNRERLLEPHRLESIRYYHNHRDEVLAKNNARNKAKRLLKNPDYENIEDIPTYSNLEYSVYFIVEKGDHTTVKIGRSYNKEDRIKGLQTGNHRVLEIWKETWVYKEADIHKMFDYLRKRSEWFIVDETLHEFITSL